MPLCVLSVKSTSVEKGRYTVMAWCLKCKNEYREGITVCAECGCELVEENKIYDMEFLYGGEDLQQLLSLKGFLEYNSIDYVELRSKDVEERNECEEIEAVMAPHALYVKDSDYHQAERIARVFFEQSRLEKLQKAQEKAAESFLFEESPKAEENENVEAVENDSHKNETYQPYVNSAQQADENRSSAWTLLVVGAIGLVVMILGIMGVIPFKLGNPYMFYGVMSAIFILFIVMGMVSMKNAKIFEKKAESENSLRDSLLKWCKENLTGDKVDERLENAEDIQAEILYFKRYEMLKKMINHQFMNLDQGFVESLIDDEVYDMVFADKQEE